MPLLTTLRCTLGTLTSKTGIVRTPFVVAFAEKEPAAWPADTTNEKAYRVVATAGATRSVQA